MIRDHHESLRDWALENEPELLDGEIPHQRVGERPTYYCDLCDEHFYGEEVEWMHNPITGTESPFHEGPDVEIGGDGYGDKCCAAMDAPTVHFVTEVTGRPRFDLFNQTADRLKEASNA